MSRKLGLKCSTSKCGSKPTGNKRNDRISQTPSRNMKNKKSMFDGVHDMCLLDFVRNVNSHAKSGCLDCYLVQLDSRTTILQGLWAMDLEVAFRKNTYFTRNLEGVDLLSEFRDINLYIISLDDMLKTSSICLLSKASKTKSCLWHRRLSHLNFSTINKLAKDGLARGIPRLKFQKDHLCSACAFGKSKKSSHQPKAEDTNQEKLYILHMDLCGPMRVASINGKRYILVIVDDYSRFTWVRFLRTKDEAPKAIIKCIKNIQVRLNATVYNVRTDNGTEFVNQTLREFYENVGISHQTSVARTPQQNDIVESCSIIRRRYNKTLYELMQDKKPDLSFFHVFGVLCYPTNDNDDLCKLDAKADIGILVGYAPAKKAFRIYNKRTWKIIETIHVTFDELTAMAFEESSSGPGLHYMTPATTSSGLVPNHIPQQSCIPPNRDDWDHLFQPMFDEYFNPPSITVPLVQDAAAPRVVVLADSPVSTSIDQDASSTKPKNFKQAMILSSSPVRSKPEIYLSFDQYQSPQYSIDHQEDLNQQRWEESKNELLNMMRSFCEMVIQRKQAANIDQSPPQEMSTPEPSDFLMGDEHLSTIPEKESDEVIKSSVEDLVPIPSESEDTSGSNKNIESKASYDSNLDEPAVLVTPLSDDNEDECFDPGGDVDEIEFLLHSDPSKISVDSILEGFTDEPPIEENE
ncbi:retrovirus-related pol polyprotein from transposon TNT 1-94 [Tanacetum coccineum]|uniref:Retrovirus-related pol polyprotein from transposon TNT 1-94 n=1 Tax=Tanacetum coccineum TaxID=301880 RepID=A0ABQ5FKN1_9ASTR